MATLSLNTEQREELATSLKETLDVVKAVDKAVDKDGPKGRRWTFGELANVADEAFDLRRHFFMDFGSAFMETPSEVIIGMLVESELIEERWAETYTCVLDMVKMGIRAKIAYDFAKE